MIREIVLHPDPRLEKKVAPIKKFGPELRRLAKDMLETLYNTDGVGLAGPQIGVMERIFVMKLRDEDGNPFGGHKVKGNSLVLVNPEVLELGEEEKEAIEGCLSIPEVGAFVTRPTRVVMQARNEWGKAKRYDVGELLARIMLHELDHLDGILFFSRVESDKHLFPMAALEEEIAKARAEHEQKLKQEAVADSKS